MSQVKIPTRFENAFQVTGGEIEGRDHPTHQSAIDRLPPGPNRRMLSRQRLEEIAHIAEKA